MSCRDSKNLTLFENMIHRTLFFFFDDSKELNFFSTWLTELNQFFHFTWLQNWTLLLNMTQSINLSFLENITQRIELYFSKKWLKELNLFFQFDSKNWILFVMNMAQRFCSLNLTLGIDVFIMTLRIEPFSYDTENCFLNDSKK